MQQFERLLVVASGQREAMLDETAFKCKFFVSGTSRCTQSQLESMLSFVQAIPFQEQVGIGHGNPPGHFGQYFLPGTKEQKKMLIQLLTLTQLTLRFVQISQKAYNNQVQVMIIRCREHRAGLDQSTLGSG